VRLDLGVRLGGEQRLAGARVVDPRLLGLEGELDAALRLAGPRFLLAEAPPLPGAP